MFGSRAQTRHQLPAEHSSSRHLQHTPSPTPNMSEYESIRVSRFPLRVWVIQNINLTQTSAGVAQDHPCVQPLHLSRPSALPRVHSPRNHVRSRILLFDVSSPIVTTAVQLSNDTAAVCQKRPFLCARSQLPPPPACSAGSASLRSSALPVSTCRVSAIPLFCSSDCITSTYPCLSRSRLLRRNQIIPRSASSQSRPIHACNH